MWRGNTKLKKVFLLGFLLALHLAFTSYVNSTFLSVFSGEKNVGIVYVFASATSLIFLFLVPKILNYMGAYKFLMWASGLNALCLLLMSLLKSGFTVIPVFIFYFMLNSLIIFALDELLQIFSESSSTGRTRGFYLTTINTAWILSQIFAGHILSNTSFSTIYIIGFTIMAVFFLTVFLSLEKLHDPEYDKVVGTDSFKAFFANANLARAYSFNFLLQFFFACMVIYMPLYLYAHLGFEWREIGVMFAIMLLPFILMQIPLGKYSDRMGERKMLMLGFGVASLATASLFFITLHVVWIWALALFMTRVGIATIEVMTDVYFFKHITRENDEFISIYRNAGPVSYIIAPLLASLVFLLAPSLNYLFLILGCMLLYGVHLASKIDKKDI
jgi:MFS family permease